MGPPCSLPPDPLADGRARNPRGCRPLPADLLHGPPFQLFGVVFSAILRCTGDMKTPWSLNALSNLVNIPFNTLFHLSPPAPSPFGRTFTIWGAGIGVPGAAEGSVIAAIFCGGKFDGPNPTAPQRPLQIRRGTAAKT